MRKQVVIGTGFLTAAYLLILIVASDGRFSLSDIGQLVIWLIVCGAMLFWIFNEPKVPAEKIDLVKTFRKLIDNPDDPQLRVKLWNYLVSLRNDPTLLSSQEIDQKFIWWAARNPIIQQFLGTLPSDVRSYLGSKGWIQY